MARFYSLKHQAMQAGIEYQTTLETLALRCTGMNIVIPYYDYVVYAWDRCFGTSATEASYAVYKFDRSPDYKYDSETPMTLVYILYQNYEHVGTAAKEGILRAEVIHAESIMRKKG